MSWEKAIEMHKTLCVKRNSPEWWSANIIESECLLDRSSKRDCALFYQYLTNPNDFDPTKILPTIDDVPEVNIEPYPKELKPVEYKNGPYETVIHVKRVSDSDDEKQS